MRDYDPKWCNIVAKLGGNMAPCGWARLTFKDGHKQVVASIRRSVDTDGIAFQSIGLVTHEGFSGDDHAAYQWVRAKIREAMNAQ